jgi:hypothetical protein
MDNTKEKNADDSQKPLLTLTVYTGKSPQGVFWCPPCESYAPVFDKIKESLTQKYDERIKINEVLIYSGSDASSPSGAVPCVTITKNGTETIISRPMKIEDVEQYINQK